MGLLGKIRFCNFGSTSSSSITIAWFLSGHLLQLGGTSTIENLHAP